VIARRKYRFRVEVAFKKPGGVRNTGQHDLVVSARRFKDRCADLLFQEIVDNLYARHAGMLDSEP